MGDVPTKEGDVAHVEAKGIDGDDEDDEEGEVDNYTTLRKSSAFTL
jgi:hypothetical protein